MDFRSKYPELFDDDIEISIGSGWDGIVDRLLADIQQESLNIGRPIKVLQVKEKFRGLRLYVDGGTPKIRELIRKAEDDSFCTCEGCGKVTDDASEFEKVKPNSHWIVTLCDDCFAKLRGANGDHRTTD